MIGRNSRTAVVTGIGMVTALGQGVEAHRLALGEGQSGVRPISRFATDHLGTRFAASVDFTASSDATPPERSEMLAALALEEAVAQSGVVGADQLVLGFPPIQFGWPERFSFARSVSEHAAGYDDLIRAALKPESRALRENFRPGASAERLAERFEVRDDALTVSSACSSGSTAIIMGVDAIRNGHADRVIVAGADASLSPEMLARFGKLSALSTRNDEPETASRPFDETRDGFVPGEGAGAVVLEAREFAEERGADILGVVSGIAEVSDGYHRLRHQPDAERIVAVMAAAIADAGLSPSDIDCVNAHGTSTPENDWMEYTGCAKVFGAALEGLPVTALKSMIGHTLSAAGAIEFAASIMMLEDQVIYPTINVATIDPKIALDIVPNTARKSRLRHILSNSFGFGGQNACIIVSR